MDIAIAGPQETPPIVIAEAWGARLRDQLSGQHGGRCSVDWTEDKEAPVRTPPAIHQWLSLRRNGALQGRVGLVWSQARPGVLSIGTEVEALPDPEFRLQRLMDILSWIMGLAGFAAWVWFAIADWPRIWNRISTFAGGHDATHATKLEVLWLLVGWALTPAIGLLLVGVFQAGLEALGMAWQGRRVRAYTKRQLAPALDALLQEALAETAQDPKLCLALGQAHPGQPHPVHANLVWADRGQYKPAEGFAWASEDPDSLAVVPKTE
jgi:hypothetical protein